MKIQGVFVLLGRVCVCVCVCVQLAGESSDTIHDSGSVCVAEEGFVWGKVR